MFQKLTDTSYVVSAWSGGTTTQLAIYPENAVYGERDFLWRVSSATVDLEDSDFTPLPDYDRLIATLEGEIVLSHNGGAPLRLRPLEVHAFSGADATHSVGRCRDFNLMLRRGHASGTMEPLRLTEAPTRLDVGTSIACPQTSPACRGGGAPQRGAEEGCRPPEAPSIPAAGTSIACPRPTPGETFLLYCVEGSCTVGTAPCRPAEGSGIRDQGSGNGEREERTVGEVTGRLSDAPSVGAAIGRPSDAPTVPLVGAVTGRPQSTPPSPISLHTGETLLCTDPIPLTLTGPATLMLCRMKLI